MVKAILYSRVSTADRQNPEIQINALRDYCRARDWTVADEIVDRISGGTDKRVGLAKLLNLVRTRQVDVIIVTKLDRMARSLRHLVGLLDEFQTLGVSFVSLGDQIDLSTASGRLMLHIVGAFAEFERSLIRERTMAGLAFARSRGKRLGRPVVSDYAAIRSLKAKGLSQAAICAHLCVSKGAVWRALRNTPKTPPEADRKNPMNLGGQDE